jgi:hypothetical protein
MRNQPGIPRGVNLIPLHRLQTRRRAARVRLWAYVVPAVASLLLATYGWLRTAWRTDAGSVRASLAHVEAAIANAEGDIKRLRADLSRSKITLKAHRAVGEQPDWGVLLHLLSGRLGDFAVLKACILEPAVGDVPGSQPGGRPGRFRLVLTGLGKDQDAIAAFLLALEAERKSNLFDRVTLLESKRVPFLGKDAVIFRTECTLSDGAAEVK